MIYRLKTQDSDNRIDLVLYLINTSKRLMGCPEKHWSKSRMSPKEQPNPKSTHNNSSENRQSSKSEGKSKSKTVKKCRK